ncbi:MAG TPA: HU family DNA-binding protein [Burkholderiales bacterium]|nr:HU family DNA-binding protein [Burkholderiales bacterium]
MNKSKLVASMAKKAGLSHKEAEKALNVMIDTITSALKVKHKVTLIGFGMFEAVQRAARTGRNPKTGAVIRISATTSPKFRPGKTLKDIIAGKAALKVKKDKPVKKAKAKPMKKVKAKVKKVKAKVVKKAKAKPMKKVKAKVVKKAKPVKKAVAKKAKPVKKAMAKVVKKVKAKVKPVKKAMAKKKK